jgi:hypothetical protein
LSAEQLEPGAIRVDDDAFLHVRDGIRGPFEKMLQLLAVFAGGGKRRRERALQPIGAQLAGGDRLQAAAVRQRHHVLRAQAHGVGDGSLIDMLAHDQHRHPGGALLFDLDERREVHAEFLDESDQHLGVDLRQCIAEVAGIRKPRAMHGVAGFAQRAVDRLDVVLRPRHDDHWNGTLFGHGSKSSVENETKV